MAGRGAMVFASVVLVVCVFLGAGEAATDCATAIAGVTGCVAFLSNPSSTPDQTTCCTPLNTVLSSPASFQCLCAQASTSDSQAFKNALLLPKACKLAINVSQANCTTASSASPANTTTTTPAAVNSSSSAKGSAGVIPASPLSPLLALALIWSIVSSFV